MAQYHVSDSAYGRTYDRTDPSNYGRSYERTDPSNYGRSYERDDHSIYGKHYEGANPSLGYGALDKSHSFDKNFGSYPATARASGWSTPNKEYEMNGGNWRAQSAASVYDNRRFDEHVTKVATEYIQPSGASSYRHGLDPTRYGDYTGKELYKSSEYPTRGDTYDYLSRKEYNGGSLKPSHGNWNTSSGHPGQLSDPTNNIGTAVRYLDEAARTVAPGSRLAQTTTTIHSYVGNLETVEPAKRYGSYFSKRSTSG